MKFDAINLDYYGTLVDWLSIWVDVSEGIVSDNNLDIDARSLALQWRNIQREILDQQEYIPYKENVTLALKRTGEQIGFAVTDYPRRILGAGIQPIYVNRRLSTQSARSCCWRKR